MQELIKTITEKAGISESQAKTAYPTDQPTIVPVIYASFAEAVVRYCW